MSQPLSAKKNMNREKPGVRPSNNTCVKEDDSDCEYTTKPVKIGIISVCTSHRQFYPVSDRYLLIGGLKPCDRSAETRRLG